MLDDIGALPAYAFYGCTGLTEIRGLETATYFGAYSLAYTGIRQVSIGADVTGFENDDPASVFMGCMNLSAIEIADRREDFLPQLRRMRLFRKISPNCISSLRRTAISNTEKN